MATLMFKIANEPHTVPTIIRPDLPAHLDEVINHALQKDVELRYARGAEMARDLRAILSSLG
jgi:hypothetical protein